MKPGPAKGGKHPPAKGGKQPPRSNRLLVYLVVRPTLASQRMLIWINGAFGVGKTLIAHELRRRHGNGHIADPELLGLALNKMLPGHARGDFQDLPAWRAALQATLNRAEAACSGPLIVPMSIVDDDYFDEVIGGLRSAGVDVRHYALSATPATLRRRLRRRSGYGIGRVRSRRDLGN